MRCMFGKTSLALVFSALVVNKDEYIIKGGSTTFCVRCDV